MLKTRVIPILLLDQNYLVKTTQFKNAYYLGDPINAVRIFNEFEIPEIIVLDISQNWELKQPNFGLIELIAIECNMPLTYGGGIKNIEQVRQIISLGVEKIVINTAAFMNPELIKNLSNEFGSQSIVGSIDVKKDFWGRYKVYVKNGKLNTVKNPFEYAKILENLGIGELLITFIPHEGTYKGYEQQLIYDISRHLSIPVIANGGAGNYNDFKLAVVSGASAVAASNLFLFHNKQKTGFLINYPSKEVLSQYLN